MLTQIYSLLFIAEEGVARTTGSGTTFNATRSWSQDVLRANYTVSSFSETVFLSGGNVTATRDVLHSYAILPNGANLTLRFEVYDQDGTMEWGSNTVSIKYVFKTSPLTPSPSLPHFLTPPFCLLASLHAVFAP